MGLGPYRLVDLTRETVVADRIGVARSFWERFRGLMRRPELPDGEGLYLATTSIHMLFMRFPIDAVFVGPPDAEGIRLVKATRTSLPPWRGIVLPVGGAQGVVELPAGTLGRARVAVGDAVRLERVAAEEEPSTTPG